MTAITWYYDFISPYAYLQSTRLGSLPADTALTCVPVLFAGLLNHWGQKGPAEVPPKRVLAFRQCIWRARRDGIPFHTPPKHPFNPLRALRLAIAMDNDVDVVQRIFQCIWVDGDLPDDEEGWLGIQAAAGVNDGDSRVAEPTVKQTLLDNGEAALSAGIFGVPTFCVGSELFWGDDCLDMMLDYMTQPGMFDDDDMRRVDTLTPSAER